MYYVAVSSGLFVLQVRNSDASWHDTRRQLRKDHRWELVELLEPSEREKLFRDHVDGLSEKKRLQFRRLLEETPQVCPRSTSRFGHVVCRV